MGWVSCAVIGCSLALLKILVLRFPFRFFVILPYPPPCPPLSSYLGPSDGGLCLLPVFALLLLTLAVGQAGFLPPFPCRRPGPVCSQAVFPSICPGPWASWRVRPCCWASPKCSRPGVPCKANISHGPASTHGSWGDGCAGLPVAQLQVWAKRGRVLAFSSLTASRWRVFGSGSGGGSSEQRPRWDGAHCPSLLPSPAPVSPCWLGGPDAFFLALVVTGWWR